MKSWRTTASGVAAILAAICAAAQLLLDNNPNTNPDWTSTMAAIMAGVGLITARDNKVSSEDVGVK
jgi:hypothetical protein